MSLDTLTLDVFSLVTRWLAVLDLARLCRVNRALRALASSDRVWQPVVAALVPARAWLALPPGPPYREAARRLWISDSLGPASVQEARDWDHVLKVVLVGDPRVGKSALIHSYATGTFMGPYGPMVHDVVTLRVKAGGCTRVVSMWEVSGADDYDRIRPLSYVDADVVLLLFSSPSDLARVRTKLAPEVSRFVGKVCGGSVALFWRLHV